VAITVALVASVTSAISCLISAVELKTFSARRRISAATSKKPFPACPALVPSSAAFNASKSLRSAMSLIRSMIPRIC
jgi:hypothetical protein